MSDDQNKRPEERSFKEEIMESLKQNRRTPQPDVEEGKPRTIRLEPEDLSVIYEDKEAKQARKMRAADERIEKAKAESRALELEETKVLEKIVVEPSEKLEKTPDKVISKSAEKPRKANPLPVPETTETKHTKKEKLDEFFKHEAESFEKEDTAKRVERRKEDKIVKKIVSILVVALLLVALVVGFAAYRTVTSGLKPLDVTEGEKVQVEIPSGSSNKQIGQILEKDQVIKNGLVFNFYTKFKNLTNFQAGYYEMAPNMTLDEISAALQKGGSAEPFDTTKITVPEGYDVDQIGDLIAKNTDFSKEEFLELMKNEDFFNQLKEKYPQLLDSASQAEGVRYRLEGYLFPATYSHNDKTTLEELVTTMVDTTNQTLTPYFGQISEKGLTVHEALTIASLVEKEGVTEEDRRKIAQVFANRTQAKMPLQSDISILYALGEHKEFVTNKDTQVDSPYNLYTNVGYGPGPFDNPSLQAIKAVLDPEPNDYVYFVADLDTGKVYYAKTYEEHMALVDKYVNK